MSMSSWVVGVVLPDAEYKKMLAVWKACEKAGVEVPQRVEEYFEGEEPDGKGLTVEIPHEEYNAEMQNGFEVELSKLDPKIKKIRFVNSY